MSALQLIKMQEVKFILHGAKQKKVTIRPTGTSLSGVTNAGNGKVKVTWLRNKSATGYRIQYSTDSKFKKECYNS